MTFRMHVIGLPFEPLPQCAYSGKHSRFVRMMRDRGHTVIEHACPEALWDPARGFDPDGAIWRAWNSLAADAIRAAAQPHDFVCVIAGRCQQELAGLIPADTIVVEYGIGYGGVFADYRVFESYAWMHTVLGSLAGSDPHRADGRFYDAVIPNYFDPNDFPFHPHPAERPYYAFVGRLIDRKGWRIAQQACEAIGADLIVAGEGDFDGYGTHVGVVGPAERAELMGGAIALFAPTQYVEPFGGVAVEAMLTGTPVITTDWGAFTETVQQGVTGFRCHRLQEFVDAAKLAGDLDREAIRAYALSRYSMDVVGAQYEAYFELLAGLWHGGWPALHNPQA